jgi:hypothetical protein
MSKFFRFEFTFCPECKSCRDPRITQITKKIVIDNTSKSIKLDKECENPLCPGVLAGKRARLHKCLTNFIPIGLPRAELELSDEELMLKKNYISDRDVKEGMKILSVRDKISKDPKTRKELRK